MNVEPCSATLRHKRTEPADEARGVDELLGALFRAQSEIPFHQRKINVPFENFQHRIERLRRRAGYSAEGFWGFVKFVRLHNGISKPLPFTRNARFEIQS